MPGALVLKAQTHVWHCCQHPWTTGRTTTAVFQNLPHRLLPQIPDSHWSVECAADQAFINSHDKDRTLPNEADADKAIADIATRFYGDLRTTERDIARKSLTKKAESLMSGGRSPLAIRSLMSRR